MGKYVVRRLLWVVVVLFFVSIITFLLAYAVPGDPAKSIAGVHATPEVLERIRTELGLDKPVYEQYRIYLTNLLQGDMGFSYETQRPVAQSILERFPATVMVVRSTGSDLVLSAGGCWRFLCLPMIRGSVLPVAERPRPPGSCQMSSSTSGVFRSFHPHCAPSPTSR